MEGREGGRYRWRGGKEREGEREGEGRKGGEREGGNRGKE